MGTQEHTSDAGNPIPFSLTKFLGFTLFLLWGYLCFFSVPLSLMHFGGGLAWTAIVEISGILGLVCALILCSLAADRPGIFPSALLLLASVALVVLAMVLLLIRASSGLAPVSAVASFAVGGASGYLLVCWASYLSKDASPVATVLLVLSVTMAALVGFMVTAIPFPYGDATALGSFLASVAFLWAVSRQDPIPAPIKREVSRKRRPMHWKTHVMFDLFGVSFGVALLMLARLEEPLAVALAVIAGGLGALADTRRAGGVYPDRMKRIMIVIEVAALLLLPFVSGFAKLLCWSVFAGLLSYFFTMQLTWTMYSGHRFKLNMASFLPEGQTHIWASMAVGYACGWALESFGLSVSILSGGLIFLLVLGSALFSPNDLEGLTLLVLKEFSQDEPGFSGPEGERRARRFIKRCSEIGRTYDLTPRETEIMVFLAKGRNAEFISERLVISKHTTKTHIYHIYRKLDISSQQVLMDMVENYYK